METKSGEKTVNDSFEKNFKQAMERAENDITRFRLCRPGLSAQQMLLIERSTQRGELGRFYPEVHNWKLDQPISLERLQQFYHNNDDRSLVVCLLFLLVLAAVFVGTIYRLCIR